jgi:holliday junction DNA helicase RuvA
VSEPVIAAVRGALEHKTLDSALVSVGGVTLRVLCPLSTLSRLEVGQTVHLHTYLLVREDALTLYGFSAEGDRATFEQLIGITGVGPRTALALLSTMSTQTLRDAILSEDVTRLTLAPGVGRKLASRLILELRPQMEKLVFGPAAGPTGDGAAPSPRGQVLEALTSLGYSPSDAAAAVRALPEDATGSLEDLILQALRSLAKES